MPVWRDLKATGADDASALEPPAVRANIGARRVAVSAEDASDAFPSRVIGVVGRDMVVLMILVESDT